MNSTRIYNSFHGVTLAPTFATHVAMCDDCKRYDPQRPATASLLCLDGSILLKRDLHKERSTRKRV